MESVLSISPSASWSGGEKKYWSVSSLLSRPRMASRPLPSFTSSVSVSVNWWSGIPHIPTKASASAGTWRKAERMRSSRCLPRTQGPKLFRRDFRIAAKTSLIAGESARSLVRSWGSDPRGSRNGKLEIRLDERGCTRVAYGTDDHDPAAGFIDPYRRDAMVDTRGAT